MNTRGGPPSDVDDADRRTVLKLETPAKVNLLLSVLGHRPDGYHELETVFQAVSLYDSIEVERRGADGPVEVSVSGMDVGPIRDNLVFRAASRFREEAKLTEGLIIRLDKRIPAGGGLGGGSSDAAATLRLLNALFGVPLPLAALHRIASELGSDIPFFLGNSPAAFGWGRGEELRALPPLPSRPIVLVIPDFSVDTGSAYRALASARSEDRGVRRARFEDVREIDWAWVERVAGNDFESALEPTHPAVGEIIQAIEQTGATVALLSGSGSTCFGVYVDDEAAENAVRSLTKQFPKYRAERLRTLESWAEPRGL